jgi:deoxyribodipyrimidine photo-lyase
LLDGDLASNHLSWQWVAGTGSRKPYLFNAENVARYAPAPWHSPGSVIDCSYDALERMARDPASRGGRGDGGAGGALVPEPGLWPVPPEDLGFTPPELSAVQGRDVWLVHPWNLGAMSEVASGSAASPNTHPPLVIGLCIADFHRAWPWSEVRWRFVGSRMAELAPLCWHGDAAAIATALQGARSVRSIHEPHLAPWLGAFAECRSAPALFASVDRRCDSFSQWWTRVTRGLTSAAELLDARESPAW